MTEPATTSAGVSIAALAIAMLGPLAGPYALILFAALAGALWPLSAAATATRIEGTWLVLRCTLTSVILTGGAASYLHSAYGLQITETIAPVAFVFGALGNGWRTVLDALSGVVSATVQRLASKPPIDPGAGGGK